MFSMREGTFSNTWSSTESRWWHGVFVCHKPWFQFGYLKVSVWPRLHLVSSSRGGFCHRRREQRLPEGDPQREPKGGIQLLLLPLRLLLGFTVRHDDPHQLVQVRPHIQHDSHTGQCSHPQSGNSLRHCFFMCTGRKHHLEHFSEVEQRFKWITCM